MAIPLADGPSFSTGRLFDSTVHDEMLRSTVRLARLTFSAAAASVFLYDKRRDELVFEASSGEGEDHLIGMALPSDRGIAGWVWNTGETIIVRDLQRDSRFDKAFAASTGYVPDEIMAAPLEVGGEALGVLEVLDPRLDRFGDLAAIDMLTELAQQSCAALSLLVAARVMRPATGPELPPLARLEEALRPRDGAHDATVDEFVTALTNLLAKAG
ncbi:GAF domain-containing protein [Microbispora sp. ATCC PTA-5024]|uniref:GAF domain-containing protein n=1 Tax=Microbispora sp. ATCC PTA-5024 TaxID=316330 RepID=UPI0003DBA6A1|nr:GAF domain-containing protein [Microbispora sp. ATCC PTA-5024]ETK37752.1 hypothetical protein MPTA5024_02130 [Microbispora sp. ATCC PTA-5024]